LKVLCWRYLEIKTRFIIFLRSRDFALQY
jgi:hypothetical protein